jgi:hypothetical protein
MSSLSKSCETRRHAKLRKAGRRRKNKEGKKSTLSYNELFAALGEVKKV